MRPLGVIIPDRHMLIDYAAINSSSPATQTWSLVSL